MWAPSTRPLKRNVQTSYNLVIRGDEELSVFLAQSFKVVSLLTDFAILRF